MTLAAAAARWLDTQPTRPQTTYNRRGYLRRSVLPHLGARAVDSLRAADMYLLGDTLREAGHEPGTICTILRTVNALLNWAVERELAPYNPMRGVARKFSGGRGTGEPMLSPDLDRFMAASHYRGRRSDLSVRDVWPVLLLTGVRIGEALALQRTHLDLDTARARIERTWLDTHDGPTKTGEAGTIDLSPAAVEFFRTLPVVHAQWLFRSSRRNVPWCRAAVERAFQEAVAAAGLAHTYTPHALRHSYAVLLLEAGAPLEYVQQQLRHASIATTRDLYGKWARIPRPAALLAPDRYLLHRRPPLPMPPGGSGR